MAEFVRGKVFVCIDAANLEQSLKSLGWRVDYKRLYRYFQNNTRLVGVRYYCPRFGDPAQDKFFVVLKKMGFKLVTKPPKNIKVSGKLKKCKANFDVEIALDMFLLSHKYDALVLFSGDSDFNYLVRLLRGKGKKVIVVSTKHHISKELIASCNKYFDLKKLQSYIERP